MTFPQAKSAAKAGLGISIKGGVKVKGYRIQSTGRTDSGTIRNVKTTTGQVKTVREVNRDVNRGVNVKTVPNSKAGLKPAPVTPFGDKHITTRPDSKRCNNLLKLPVHNK